MRVFILALLCLFASAESLPTDDLCVSCVHVVGDIEYQIMTHEAIIEKVLNATLCRDQGCYDFVSHYFPIFVKMLNAQLSAPVICTFLDLCPSSKVKPQSPSRL